MKSSHKRWVVPPMFGVAFVVVAFALMFCVNASSLIAHLIGWPAEIIYNLHMEYRLPPYGGDKGFAWFIIAPVIGFIAWFIVGTILGYLWVNFRRGNSLSGEPYADEISSRQAGKQIRNRPEYESFLADRPERQFLYDEDLPTVFGNWLDQKQQSEHASDGKTPESPQSPH
jgi:hypothetical protein